MPAISSLLLPPSDLSACLFAGIYRDTRGAKLSARDRYNHFPASPLVAVTMVRQGELRIVGHDPTKPGDRYTILPSLSCTGPSKTPISSWSPDALVALTVGIYPDAWRQLGGNADYKVIPGVIKEALRVFDGQEDIRPGWQSFCDELRPIWHRHRPVGHRIIDNLADWGRHLMARAALSGTGRSLRTLERRIKRMSGQNQRDLQFYGAMEQLHQTVQQNKGAALADIAIEAGYADQSHMGRAVRRATGFSPGYLNNSIEKDEAFWCYRLLGERF